MYVRNSCMLRQTVLHLYPSTPTVRIKSLNTQITNIIYIYIANAFPCWKRGRPLLPDNFSIHNNRNDSLSFQLKLTCVLKVWGLWNSVLLMDLLSELQNRFISGYICSLVCKDQSCALRKIEGLGCSKTVKSRVPSRWFAWKN